MSKEQRSQIKSEDRLKRKVKIKSPINLNKKQEHFLDIALDEDTKMMFVSGPAGTSKTFLAILSTLQLLNDKRISKILYIRSAVESTDNKLGYLPGEEAMKLEPYLRPLRDKLVEFLSDTEIKFLYSQGKIDAEHVGYARGQDWKNIGIVIDEAQNLTKKEILTLITRIGKNSTVFIVGDPMQSDIRGKSGLKDFIDLFSKNEKSNLNGIYTFEFNKSDIVRSELVKFIISTVEESDLEL